MKPPSEPTHGPQRSPRRPQARPTRPKGNALPDPQARRARLRETEPESLRPARRGRGARANPTGRFERRTIALDVFDPDLPPRTEAPEPVERAPASKTPAHPPGKSSPAPTDPSAPPTITIPDPARTAITYNQSPDIPFEASLNPYRGCEHGCAYCYARPTHEYLGYSAGLDFETKILVKEKAPELLRRELAAPRWKPQVVALSGVTDAYQPIERKLELTRRCLQVFAEFRNPIMIVTKNALVTRDLDLLRQLAEHQAVSVCLSITTLDGALQRALEPRASAAHERLRAIERLAEAGIPTGVMVAPIIPGLTDAETPAILAAAASAGATRAGQIVLRLPHGLRDLFDDWLLTHRPLRRDKVLSRLQSLRSGADAKTNTAKASGNETREARLNDPRFGTRMRGEGHFAEQIAGLFELMARKHGLRSEHPPLSTASFRHPEGTQLGLGL